MKAAISGGFDLKILRICCILSVFVNCSLRYFSWIDLHFQFIFYISHQFKRREMKLLTFGSPEIFVRSKWIELIIEEKWIFKMLLFIFESCQYIKSKWASMRFFISSAVPNNSLICISTCSIVLWVWCLKYGNTVAFLFICLFVPSNSNGNFLSKIITIIYFFFVALNKFEK